MSATAFTHSSSEVHTHQVPQPAASPASSTVTPDVSSVENFSTPEVIQFRNDDAEAGRNICRILCTLFTVSVILSGIVCWWTFS